MQTMGVRLVAALAAFIFAGVLLAPSPTPAAVVWRDGFSSQGLEASKWYARGGCPSERSAEGWLCYSPDNAYVEGGFLHMRQTPNDGRFCCSFDRPYLGSMVSTYKHGSGWPSKSVLASWTPPVLIEARIRYSGADGLWQNFETFSVDLDQPTEFDAAEMRGAKEHYQFCAVHRRPEHIHLGTQLPYNYTARFRRYWIYYEPARVTFGVGDTVCGSTMLAEPAGNIGIDFVAKSADPDLFPWPGLGGPVVGSPEYLVDWVRVSQ